jgi:hypothetical protein
LLETTALLILMLAAGAASFAIVIRSGPLGTTAWLATPVWTIRADDEKLSEAAGLARATLVALAAAHRSADYTAFRARSAPAFQTAHSTEALARIFAGQRSSGIDLAAVAERAPRWEAEPRLDGEDLLMMTALYPAGELYSVRLDLVVQAVAGQWKLYDIDLSLRR